MLQVLFWRSPAFRSAPTFHPRVSERDVGEFASIQSERPQVLRDSAKHQHGDLKAVRNRKLGLLEYHVNCSRFLLKLVNGRFELQIRIHYLICGLPECVHRFEVAAQEFSKRAPRSGQDGVIEFNRGPTNRHELARPFKMTTAQANRADAGRVRADEQSHPLRRQWRAAPESGSQAIRSNPSAQSEELVEIVALAHCRRFLAEATDTWNGKSNSSTSIPVSHKPTHVDDGAAWDPQHWVTLATLRVVGCLGTAAGSPLLLFQQVGKFAQATARRRRTIGFWS